MHADTVACIYDCQSADPPCRVGLYLATIHALVALEFCILQRSRHRGFSAVALETVRGGEKGLPVLMENMDQIQSSS